MNQPESSELDLTISRIIRAPRPVVWSAWAIPSSLEQWWAPLPARCKVLEMELRPGGSFVTQISEDGKVFNSPEPGCFLAVDELERIVFTDALAGGWRPAEASFMTAIITFADHPLGTEYRAHVLHKNNADRKMHEEMGFHQGWGKAAEQLAVLVERRP